MIPKTALLVLVTTLVLTAAAAQTEPLPRSTAVTGNPYLALELPPGWHENSRSDTAKSSITDYVKDGELDDNWTQILTIEVTRGHIHGSLKTATDYFTNFMTTVCQVTAVTTTSGYMMGVRFGSRYPELFQQTECAKFKKTNYGETIVNRPISTPNNDFILQWAWRYPGLSDESGEARRIDTIRGEFYLYGVKVCEPADTIPTCLHAALKIQ